jgi:hypothetical protein
VAMELQKEAESESDVQDLVANPVRFVRREEIAVKLRSLMRGVARRGVREDWRTNWTDLQMPRIFSTKKKNEKGVTVVTQSSLATGT